MSCRPRPQIARKRSRSSAPKNLGERLYEWRKKNDFSQSEAAVKLQISKRTLQEWEQSRAQPRHLALDAITKLIKGEFEAGSRRIEHR
jgi:DNA-binding transcriptional regulator YiaG